MTLLDHAFHFRSSACSHVGVVRKLNEDAFLDRPDLGLWVVADGMGGHDSGDLASGMVVQALDGIMPMASGAALLTEVKSRLDQVHRELRAEAARRGPEHLIGTTVVALLVSGQRFACVWAGDSRLYLLRDGVLVQLTRDHSHVQELVELGELRPEDADHHPHANVITRAVGAAEDLGLELCRDRLEPDDVLLLCSDGLSRVVPQREIAGVLASGDIDRAAQRLVDLAIEHGTRDNVTAVVVACEGAAPEPGQPLPPPPVRTEVSTLPRPMDAVEDATLPPGTVPGAGGLPTAPPAEAERQAPRIGRFELQDKIGEGALAEVYRAVDTASGTAVALKVLRPEARDDADYFARFIREAKAAGSLSHPNIVAVLDSGEADDRAYIAMELVDGQPLDRTIAETAPLPVEDVLAIGVQLANALGYAHTHGVIHRDVKPSNILLRRDSIAVGIKVTDFGVARFEEPGRTHVTRSSIVLGTPHYMSPEQACGSPLDGRSDLFAVGTVLYEMLTGRKPFTAADGVAGLMVAIVEDDPPPLRSVQPDVPEAVAAIVERLLRKQPDQRFSTGEALAAALRQELEALRQVPVLPARRPTPPPSPRAGGRLPPWLPWLALGGVALAAAVAAVWMLYRSQASAAELLPEPGGQAVVATPPAQMAGPSAGIRPAD